MKNVTAFISGLIASFLILAIMCKCQNTTTPEITDNESQAIEQSDTATYDWYVDNKDNIQTKQRKRRDLISPKFLYTGQIRFDFNSSHGKIWAKNENFNLVLKNVYSQFNIDNFKDSDVKKWIKSTGIDTNDIIFVKAFGSSDKQAIECFFAYLSTDTVEYRDVCILTGSLNCDYQKRSGIRFSNFLYINTQDCKDAIKQMCLNYDVKTYFVRSMEVPQAPLLVIARGVRDGYSMDMRNVAKSYRLVDYFKELNWYNIKYQDQLGKDASIVRPKTGW